MKRYSPICALLLVCLVCTACDAIGLGSPRERLNEALDKVEKTGQAIEPPALPSRAPDGQPSRVALPGVLGQRTLSAEAATIAAAAQATLAAGANALLTVTPQAPTGQVALPGVLGQRTPSWTPGANVTAEAAPVAPQQAQEALSAAIKALKGNEVRVSTAQGYTGSASLPLPPAMQNAFSAVLGADATGYYGTYGALNIAVTATGAGGQASGALTLLVEPKAASPANAEQAQAQLKQFFAGVTVALTPVPQVENLGLPAGYAFYGLGSNTAYLLGFATVEGKTVAYAISGSGSYQGMVPKP